MVRDVDGRPDNFEMVRLILARQRRQGAGFEQAWQLALGALERPVEGKLEADLASAVAALEGTQDAWRCGYERRPLPPPRYGRAADAARLRAIRAAIAA
jgi:hypothetical protein